MTRRDTRTGAVLEEMVLAALKQEGYNCNTQVHIGERLGAGKHKVDIVAEDAAGRICLVSLKWQQVPGTAEQKVPFEATCLADVILKSGDKHDKAYMVLGGEGWKLREFFAGGGLRKYLVHGDLVEITTLERFIARANRGQI